MHSAAQRRDAPGALYAKGRARREEAVRRCAFLPPSFLPNTVLFSLEIVRGSGKAPHHASPSAPEKQGDRILANDRQKIGLAMVTLGRLTAVGTSGDGPAKVRMRTAANILSGPGVALLA